PILSGELGELRRPGAGAAQEGLLEALLAGLAHDVGGLLIAGPERDAVRVQRLDFGDLGAEVDVFGLIGQRLLDLDAGLLEEGGEPQAALGRRHCVGGVVEDGRRLHAVTLLPDLDGRRQLLVAGERVAERPRGERGDARLGRALGDDHGAQLVQQRGQRFELRREARAQDGQYLVLEDRLAGQRDGGGNLRARGADDDLQGNPRGAAGRVDLLDGDLGGDLAVLAPLGALAGDRIDRTELDAFAGELGLGGYRAGWRERDGDDDQHDPQPAPHAISSFSRPGRRRRSAASNR